MIVPHKPCPWCGTVKYIYPTSDYQTSARYIYCDNCGCCGPTVSPFRKTDAEATAEAWKVWDEFGNGNQWQDYEVTG